VFHFPRTRSRAVRGLFTGEHFPRPRQKLVVPTRATGFDAAQDASDLSSSLFLISRFLEIISRAERSRVITGSVMLFCTSRENWPRDLTAYLYIGTLVLDGKTW